MRSPLLNQLLEDAKASPRKRAFHMLSEENADRQIMINLFLKNSYVRPHKHTHSESGETFQSIYGQFAILQFTEEGELGDVFLLEKDKSIAVPVGIYHTAICLTDSACLLETKNGRYDPTDKVFLDTAPPEGITLLAIDYRRAITDYVVRQLEKKN